MDGLKGRALAKARSLRASEQSRQAYLSSLTSISSLVKCGGILLLLRWRSVAAAHSRVAGPDAVQ
jgi:hypothetical protein